MPTAARALEALGCFNPIVPAGNDPMLPAPDAITRYHVMESGYAAQQVRLLAKGQRLLLRLLLWYLT